MIKLKQTRLHTEEVDGNCWSTCIACLLELKEIPDLNVRCKDYMEITNNFIRSHGYDLIEIKINENLHWNFPEGLIVIATGKSPRQPNFEKDKDREYICHCVIGKLNYDPSGTRCEFIHDPHPDNTNIETLEWISILIPKV